MSLDLRERLGGLCGFLSSPRLPFLSGFFSRWNGFLIGTERGVFCFLFSHFRGFFSGGTEQDDMMFSGAKEMDSRPHEHERTVTFCRHVSCLKAYENGVATENQKWKTKWRQMCTCTGLIVYPSRLLMRIKEHYFQSSKSFLSRFHSMWIIFSISIEKENSSS